jgi:hypothetical protein
MDSWPLDSLKSANSSEAMGTRTDDFERYVTAQAEAVLVNAGYRCSSRDVFLSIVGRPTTRLLRLPESSA